MTRNYRRFVALLVSLLLVASVAIPGAVAGATAQDGDLTLEVTQDKATGEVHVTLTDNGTAAENATIDVSGDPYDGNGTHELDANGSITLPNPNETATVTIEAVANDSRNVSDSFDLVPYADSLSVSVNQTESDVEIMVEQYGEAVEDATVNVTSAEETDYAGLGEYQTDANGSVTLENPDLPVNITVAATYNDLSASTEAQLEGEGLDIDLTQDESYNATVTVTRGDTPIDNATVEVTSDAPYEGNGTYDTDENGTVGLPAPADPLNVTVNATTDSLTAEEVFFLNSAELSLSVSQAADYSVVIDVAYDGEPADGANVTVEGDYAYAGMYTAENGSVTLNPPANNTTIDVTAEYMDETATVTDFAIEANESSGESGFAKALVKYIEFVKMENLSVPGQYISAFVHENNPSSADDDAGPPEHAGPKNSATASSDNETDTHGPPEWAGPKDKNATDVNATAESGPPDHAGNGKDKDKKGNGPPDHANND